MARPSLADSLRASLDKGDHVDTAAKIARGFAPVPDDIPIDTPQKAGGTDGQTVVTPLTPSPIVESVIPPATIKQDPVVAAQVGTKPLDRLSVSPLDGDTVTQLNGHTVIPSHSNTVTRLDGDTVSRSHSLTVSQSDSQTVIPLDTKTVIRSQSDTVSQPHQQTVSQTQTAPHTVLGYIPLGVLTLSYNQAYVLEHLISNTSGITNARSISDATHITIPSVREAILRLIDKGFMLKPVTVKNGAFQGFSYVLNKTLCDHFLNAGGLSQDNYRRHETVHETVSGSKGMTVTPPDRLTVYSSNKPLETKNLTTTSLPESVSQSNGGTVSPSHPHTVIPSNGGTLTPSNGFILTGAVGAYWEEEGLGEGQAQKWCSQFEVEAGQMKQQLDWARYDLEVNGRRGEVKKDPVSWFFGHLRTTGGCFPKPINYKSPLEIRVESMENELAQEKALKERLATAEMEQRFQKILSDPSSAEYQELYNQVSSFAKEEGGVALVCSLRDAFFS